MSSSTQSLFASADLAATIRHHIIPLYSHSHIRVCMLIIANVAHVARGYLPVAIHSSSVHDYRTGTHVLSRVRG
jgi:hypothetical protein